MAIDPVTRLEAKCADAADFVRGNLNAKVPGRDRDLLCVVCSVCGASDNSHTHGSGDDNGHQSHRRRAHPPNHPHVVPFHESAVIHRDAHASISKIHT